MLLCPSWSSDGAGGPRYAGITPSLAHYLRFLGAFPLSMNSIFLNVLALLGRNVLHLCRRISGAWCQHHGKKRILRIKKRA